MTNVEVKVPDIGDFKSVEVIEVLVKPGDTVAKEQSLITLESDKATMEIPSPGAGTVQSIKVKVGDKVAQGSTILVLDSAGEEKPRKEEKQETTTAKASSGEHDCDVVVIGAGPGGYSAAFRAADLGLRTVLVERYPVLGGVCLNVGCIPSKALLHTAAVMDAARGLADHGVSFGEPKLDLAKLRAFKEKVVGKLTGGLTAMAKMRKVTVMTGVAKFLDKNTLEVAGKRLRFANAIIAVGSQAAKLPFLPQDPRIVDSTGALELKGVPKKMLIIGGGIIGLEMGTVYSTLGTRLDVVEMMDGLMLGADRDLVAVWQKMNAKRFDSIMLGTKTTKVEAAKDGLKVTFDGKPAQTYDAILVSVGRAPNGKNIAADKAGITVDAKGFISVDSQMRTNVPNIYAIGDVAGNPMLAHKAVHEGHVAAEAAAGQKSHFDARVIPSVAYTDPEIAWVGVTEDEAKKSGAAIGVAKFPWSASGRAIANARDEGFTKLIFDSETHRVVGAGIVGTGAGDLISEMALAVEMGADATDIGKTIHPHPTTSESVGMAAELFEGVCTDMPPVREEMTQDELKKQVAEAALQYAQEGIIGVGSGSTVNFFIDSLSKIKHKIEGAVAASENSAARLKQHGIRVYDLNSVNDLAVYVDGADEVTENLHMIKGGGGALTREKIVAAVARKFVCICDASKLVGVLGKFPLPVEVIPMARSYVGRELVKLGGLPELRQGFTTDNGNVVLDVRGMTLLDPPKIEREINQLAGVVSNGIFARRPADVLLLASNSGIQTLKTK